jgi:hypothetical protein
MFCNKCGVALDAASQYCPRCGAPAAVQPAVSAVPGALRYTESNLVRRLPVLAILWIIYGVFETARAAAVHFFARMSHPWFAGPNWSQWAGPWVLGWLVAWSSFNAVLAFVAAWGLHERRSWGRTTAIVAAVFALAHPLLGTVLEVYTLVVLLSGDAGRQYDSLARV